MQTKFLYFVQVYLKVARSFAYLLIKVSLNFVWSSLNTFGSTLQNIKKTFQLLKRLEIVILWLNTHFVFCKYCFLKAISERSSILLNTQSLVCLGFGVRGVDRGCTTNILNKPKNNKVNII